MNTPSSTHLLLIPSYNSGSIVITVVKQALDVWQPVWVVVDGSHDGSAELLQQLARTEPALTILQHTDNQGKGSAVFTGIQAAVQQGFTHVLTMDADGQHPVNKIRTFMSASQVHPDALILGVPIFDEDAPALRVNGRKISNFWANLETLWGGINDSLFGFRIYPIQPLIQVMQSSHFARRFDFDPEVVVRLVWCGLATINLPVPVRYLSSEEGGISQFRYLRDNTLLTWMHIRLFSEFLIRWPTLLWRRIKTAVL